MVKTSNFDRKKTRGHESNESVIEYIPTGHETVISRTVNADVDKGIVNVIDFLNDNGIVTLHCCEGSPSSLRKNASEKKLRIVEQGYIHFADANHLERTLILLAEVAEEAGEWALSGRILNQTNEYPEDDSYGLFLKKRWKYEVAWSSARVEGVEGFRGWRFTAVARFDHEDAVLLNSLLADRMDEAEDAWYAGYTIDYETGSLVRRS